MITETIKLFVEKVPLAFVASADENGHPHLAAGRELKVLDADNLVLENWFCPTTLRNVAHNPRVAVAVTAGASGDGYQFAGVVIQASDAALLDGYVPGGEDAGVPQVLTRLVVRVEAIMEFSAGVHTDLSLNPGG